MLLEHKKAVIYGAGGAIGGAVARAFADEGADLFLAGRTRARVESIADEISAAGGVAESRRGARTTRDPARHPAVGRVAGRARHQADLRASRPGRRDLSRGVLGRGEQRNLASASSDAVRGGRGRGRHGFRSCQRDDRGHGQRHVWVLGRRVSPAALTTDAARQPRRRTGASGHS
jgi:NAD(P)-dependent dehydrogenase (short-subunit alcohol dehydrogenase family)